MDVDLGDQYMRVYRGNTVIAATYVSTGRPGFTTPTGNFYINHKDSENLKSPPTRTLA